MVENSMKLAATYYKRTYPTIDQWILLLKKENVLTAQNQHGCPNI